MHRIAALALLLSACTAATPVPQGFRAAAAPIYSAAAFDPARLAGPWRQAAAFSRETRQACTSGEITIRPDGGIDGALCLDGRRVAVAGRLRVVGPGRVQVSGADPAGIGAPWWVVWVDEGYRTLAIGTPSGAFGFVLDRSGALPEDRLRAAAEIFDFNGYDRRLLQRLP